MKASPQNNERRCPTYLIVPNFIYIYIYKTLQKKLRYIVDHSRSLLYSALRKKFKDLKTYLLDIIFILHKSILYLNTAK